MNKSKQGKDLPPLPKLRPRPGFRNRNEPPQPPSIPRAQNSNYNRATSTTLVVPDDLSESKRKSDEETTSRLLMKSECKGAGRKRNSGSLVHSIPKFSQVKPNGRLTEIQKVLQSRIIMKQQRLIQQQQQQQQQEIISHGRKNQSNKEIQQNVSTATIQQNKSSVSTKSINPYKTDFPKPTFTHLSSSTKRRGRKPAKDEICHVVTSAAAERPKPSTYTSINANTSSSTFNAKKPVVSMDRNQTNVIKGKGSKDSRIRAAPMGPAIPFLSEVTITPTLVPVSAKKVNELDKALDLRKERKSPSPEIVEIAITSSTGVERRVTEETIASPVVMKSFACPPMMYPDEYEKWKMPPGYVFCPGPNVFVHHSSLPPQFINPGSQSVSNAHQLAKFQTPNIDPTVAQQQQQLEVLNSSPTRKRRLNNLHPPSTSQNEVSICKFKFTGGSKPSLEEKKKLSLDAGGNLRYFSGSGEKALQAFESLPPDIISRAGASLMTDRFTALTAERIAKSGNGSSTTSGGGQRTIGNQAEQKS